MIIRSFPLLVVSLGVFAPGVAHSAEVAPRRRLSERLAREISDTLPRYDATQVAAKPAETSTASPDSDVILLPKVHVQESPTPRVHSDQMLSRDELNRKKLRDYKKSLTGLNRVLNGFSLPFVGPSMAARADAAYRDRRRHAEMEQLLSIIDVARSVDPAGAAELRKELLNAPDRRSLGRKR